MLFLEDEFILASQLPEVKSEGEISAYYVEELKKMGISLNQLKLQSMSQKDWLLADLTLQALKNWLRVSSALVVHWVDDLGFFTNQDLDSARLPRTVQEMLHYLRMPPPRPFPKPAENFDPRTRKIDPHICRLFHHSKPT